MQGGTLTRHVVCRMPDEAENIYIDDFGTIRWTWAEGYTGPKKVELEIVSKRGV